MEHTARKRFGQHFLCDQHVIERILAAIAPAVTDHLVEIGPGQGALTFPLLKRVHTLEAVELDRDLIARLQARGNKIGHLVLFSADALDVDFAALKKDDRPLRIIGNLPYNISTPLIFHLLTFTSVVSDMIFMLQKEVAERLAAAPDSAHYGRLSVMVQYYCQPDVLFNVLPAAFFPPPQVQSAIVRLVPYPALPHPAKDETLFAQVVKAAFSQRRKTLRNSLKRLVSDALWAKLPIQPSQRAETLSVKEFVLISDAITNEQQAGPSS